METGGLYASHSMSNTECHYGQIQKEAFAITWACEKFADYIVDTEITIETDHKLLVPLLLSKKLDSLAHAFTNSLISSSYESIRIQHPSCSRKESQHS